MAGSDILAGLIVQEMQAAGFDVGSDKAKTKDLAEAIAKAIDTFLTTNCKVTVDFSTGTASTPSGGPVQGAAVGTIVTGG